MLFLIKIYMIKNAHANVSTLYKGRVPLRIKILTRQLRAAHVDEHNAFSLHDGISHLIPRQHYFCVHGR